MPKTAFVPDDYVSVATRIEKFWEDHPNGSIHTELTEERLNGTAMNSDGPIMAWICKAEIRKDAATVTIVAEGHARQELLTEPPKKRDGKPNDFAPEWTSPVEVVETSAIGRALANMGYQTKSRASREEVQKAQDAGGASDTNLHDDTYAYAVEQLGDAAADIFVPALGRAGITAGNWITTDEQAKQVRDEIDAAS